MNLRRIRDQNRSQTRRRTVATTIQHCARQSNFRMGKRTEKNKELETNTNRTAKDNIEVTYFAFADDLALLSDNEQTSIEQIKVLKECAEEVGLSISFQE